MPVERNQEATRTLNILLKGVPKTAEGMAAAVNLTGDHLEHLEDQDLRKVGLEEEEDLEDEETENSAPRRP